MITIRSKTPLTGTAHDTIDYRVPLAMPSVRCTFQARADKYVEEGGTLKWKDLYDDTRLAQQATEGNKPTFEAVVPALGNRAAWKHLTPPDYFALPSVMPTSGPFTKIWVGIIPSGVVGTQNLFSGNSGGHYLAVNDTLGVRFSNNGSADMLTVAPGDVPKDVGVAIMATYGAGGAATIQINGEVAASGTLVQNVTNNTLAMGARGGANGLGAGGMTAFGQLLGADLAAAAYAAKLALMWEWIAYEYEIELAS